MMALTAGIEKPEALKKPKIKEPEFKAVRFRSQVRGMKYVIVPRREWKIVDRKGYPEKMSSPGKYLFTDGNGETAPVSDPAILKWYLSPRGATYRYEMVCLWPGEKHPRDFGCEIGEAERKRLEELIAYLEASEAPKSN